MIRAALLAASFALCLSATPAMAKVDKDMEAVKNYVVTPVFLQKLQAAEKDMKALKKNKDEDDDNDSDSDKDSSIDGIVRKIESEPRAKAVLAKYNIAPREMALATYAMLHAGMWVATESVMDKKKAAASYAALTSAQKSNIELMRTYSKQANKK